MNKDVNKKIKTAAMDIVEDNIEDVYLRLHVPEVIDIIENSYDFLAGSVIFHKKSKLKLQKFKSLYMERINDHPFLDIDYSFSGYTVKFDIPSIDTFDFSNGLELLELIVLGVPAEYLEVDDRSRRRISPTFPKAPLSFRVDNTVVYLYDTKRYNTLRGTLREKGLDIMVFPFSPKNKGYDLFEDANDYDDDNFESMLELVHNNTTKDLKNELRR